MSRGKRRLNAHVNRVLRIGQGDSVLEVGFGPGVTLAHLAAAHPGARFIGVDPSAVMLCQAAGRNRAAMLAGQVELRLGTAERLPLGDETVEHVLVLHSLHHWSDPLAGLQQLHRVLKPDGSALVGLRGRPETAIGSVADSLAAAGFAAVREAPAPSGVSSTFLLADREAAR
jgi:ubiquinone/menaquinone biosynthesis C-methylase UbiE